MSTLVLEEIRARYRSSLKDRGAVKRTAYLDVLFQVEKIEKRGRVVRDPIVIQIIKNLIFLHRKFSDFDGIYVRTLEKYVPEPMTHEEIVKWVSLRFPIHSIGQLKKIGYQHRLQLMHIIVDELLGQITRQEAIDLLKKEYNLPKDF